MIDPTDVNSLFGATVLDREGARVGTVKQVYLDGEGGAPRFATVSTGLFGLAETFVPLRSASFDGESLRVAYDKATVKDAPRIDADGELGDEDQDRILRYYEGDEERDVPVLVDDADEAGEHETDRAERAPTADRIEEADWIERTGPLERTRRPKHADLAPDLPDDRPRDPVADAPNGRVRLRRYVVIEEETIVPSAPGDDPGARREPGSGDEHDDRRFR